MEICSYLYVGLSPCSCPWPLDPWSPLLDPLVGAPIGGLLALTLALVCFILALCWPPIEDHIGRPIAALLAPYWPPYWRPIDLLFVLIGPLYWAPDWRIISNPRGPLLATYWPS